MCHLLFCWFHSFDFLFLILITPTAGSDHVVERIKAFQDLFFKSFRPNTRDCKFVWINGFISKLLFSYCMKRALSWFKDLKRYKFCIRVVVCLWCLLPGDKHTSRQNSIYIAAVKHPDTFQNVVVYYSLIMLLVSNFNQKLNFRCMW